MKCKYLIVSSITYAVKARDVLEIKGIASKIEKIKNVKSLNGCGFGLKLASAEVGIALKYMNASGIKIIDIIDCEAKSK